MFSLIRVHGITWFWPVNFNLISLRNVALIFTASLQPNEVRDWLNGINYLMARIEAGENDSMRFGYSFNDQMDAHKWSNVMNVWNELLWILAALMHNVLDERRSVNSPVKSVHWVFAHKWIEKLRPLDDVTVERFTNWTTMAPQNNW